MLDLIFNQSCIYIPVADIVSLRRKKSFLYKLCKGRNVVSSSTFLKMFYKRKKIVKQTSHCLFSGTCSVSSCNVYKSTRFFLLLYVILCKYFFTLLLILNTLQGIIIKNYASSKKQNVPASFFSYLRDTKLFRFYKAKDRNSFIKFTVWGKGGCMY